MNHQLVTAAAKTNNSEVSSQQQDTTTTTLTTTATTFATRIITTTATRTNRKRIMYEDMTIENQRKLRVKYLNAAKNNNMKSMKYCIHKSVPINAISEVTIESGMTALHMASVHGYIEIVKYLVEECHIDINLQCSSQRTALHEASINNRVDIVKYFIMECKSTCNPHIQDESGRNVLHFVSRRGHIDIVQYLVKEYNMNVDIGGYGGFTALLLAMEYDQYDLVRYYIEECHADITATNYYGKNVFDYACKSKHLTDIVLTIIVNYWRQPKKKIDKQQLQHGRMMLE